MTGVVPAGLRRSWFEGPRLWPVAVGLVVAVLTGSAAASASMGHSPLDDISFVVFVAAGGVGGTALKSRWVRREWRRLHEAGLADGQDRLAAEAVVRDRVAPTCEDQRQLALRITEQRWRDSGGWLQGPALAVIAVVALVPLAVAGSSWWWLLCAASAVAAVVLGRSAARLARRRAELEGLR